MFRLKRLVPKASYVQYERDSGIQINSKHKHLFGKDDKLSIHIDWWCKDRITLRDGVNMEQGIWDILQDNEVIHNDAQFYKWSGTKGLDKVNPRVIIYISKINDRGINVDK